MDLRLQLGNYPNVKSTWPKSGRIILATYNEDKIILYQAYNSTIAQHAVAHQTFANCPEFSTTRMTWLKPNFLWMMFRSGWAQKHNQEHVLAVTITRDGFEEFLRADSNVRLQWDPDHDPHGSKECRRAIQLGIKNRILDRFLSEWIVRIEDITGFVKEQRVFVESNRLDLLQVPYERVYELKDKSLAAKIELDG